MKKVLVAVSLVFLLALAACNSHTTAPADEPDAPDKQITVLPIPTETEAVTPVSFQNDTMTVSLNLPDGWEYESIEDPNMGIIHGIRFYPTTPAEVTVINERCLEVGEESQFYRPSATIGFYNGSFGVCGTGLQEEQAILSNGTEVCVGYYDGNPDWSFVSFRAIDKTLAAVNDCLIGADARQAYDILLSLTYSTE